MTSILDQLGAVDVVAINPQQLAWLELNDLGNAERMVAHAGGRLCYVHEWGWLAYDRGFWSREQGERLAAIAAHEVARGCRAQADALDDLKERPADWWDGCTAQMLAQRAIDLRKWVVTSGNSNKLNGMMSQAAHLLDVPIETFDRDRFTLNVANGTLRFVMDEGEVRVDFQEEHDPGDRVTRLTEVHYDPHAKAPRWLKHLDTCLPIKAVREFLQEVIGYSVTGSIGEQCIFIHQGRGGDGKSTTMNVLRRILGTYGATAGVRTFLAGAMKDGASASPDMARLGGDVRLVSTGEPPVGAKLDDNIIKTVTGGAPVVARELNKPPVEYVPRFKVHFECNKRPRISGDDDGIWRRIVIIPWPHQFKGTEIVKGFEDQLMAEASGILNWVIEGVKRWMLSGRLVLPEVVTEAVDDYRKSGNPFGEWFGERVIVDPDAVTSAKSFYENYKGWCEGNGIPDGDIMSNTAFGRALGDKQILRKKDGQGLIQRKGARLRGVADDDAALAAHDAMAAEEWPQ